MIKAVLFDLDGTLLDSAPDLVASLNHLRADLGLDAMPLKDLRHFASRGAIGLIKAGMPPCDDETLATWREAFLSHYEKNSFIHSRSFDGVESLLSELSNRDIPWGIVTNKMEYLSFPIIEKAGWLSRASVVICGDSVANSKPHPEPVLAACRTIGIDPANALMVGDDIRDIEAGKRAGSHTAFALYGYADSESQSEFDADTALIHSPEEVLELLC
jgi:2-phosphoglycolate phosphatase